MEVVSSQGQLHVGLEGDRFPEIFFHRSRRFWNIWTATACILNRESGWKRALRPWTRWETSRMRSAGRGFVVFIDYGYTREEQLAGRHRGTLKSIRRHAITASPYESPGEQDITADVNFSAVAAAAELPAWSLWDW